MNSQRSITSIAPRSRTVNWFRVLLDEIGVSTKSSDRNTAQDKATSCVHTIIAQQKQTFDWDDEGFWDFISQKSNRELSNQQAKVTQAVSKILGCPTSNFSTGEDYSSKPFSSDELAGILDTVCDQPSAYPGIWTNTAYSAIKPSWGTRAEEVEIAIIHAIITTSTRACGRHFSKVLDPRQDKDLGAFAPPIDVPPSDFDATSLFANNGSCRSGSLKSNEALIKNTPFQSLKDYAPQLLGDINHQEHPAFCARVWADDTSNPSDNVDIYHHDLFDQRLISRVRGSAPLPLSEVRPNRLINPHPRDKYESSTTKRTSPVDAIALPSRFVSGNKEHGNHTAGLFTNLGSMIPDSPTLGDNTDRDVWSFSSHGENLIHSDSVPRVAPLRFTRWPTTFGGLLDQAVPGLLSTETHSCTKSRLRSSYLSKGNRNCFPSQHGFEDDGTAFLHHGLDDRLFEEMDLNLRDGLDQWPANNFWDDDGFEDDDRLDCGEIEQGFSQAFLVSPLCPTKIQCSPPTPRSSILQPGGLIKGAARRSIEDLAEVSDESGDAFNHNSVPAPNNVTTQVRLDNLEILRAYRREQAEKGSEPSSDKAFGNPIAPGSRPKARSRAKPTFPNDEKVNLYSTKTNSVFPVNLITLGVDNEASRTRNSGLAVNTTAPLASETLIESTALRPALDFQPQATSRAKNFAKKINLSVITASHKSPSKPPTTSHTSNSATKKKMRFTGSWSRKGYPPAERQKVPDAESLCSPLLHCPSSGRTSMDLMSFTPPVSPRSLSDMTPANQLHHQSPSPPIAPSTPIEELPLIPPRNPLRIARMRSSVEVGPRISPDRQVCPTSPLKSRRESRSSIDQLDPNARKFYVEQKLYQLRQRENTRVVFHHTLGPQVDYMRHPRHNRVWNSRNLRCSVHEGSCPICAAACCRHENSVRVIRDLASLPEEKIHASNLLSEIKAWCKTDEEPTFVRCNLCKKKLLAKIQFAQLSPRARQVVEPASSTEQTHYRSQAAIMRTYEDTFSGEKIYPGKGKLYVRGDSKIFRFQNGKTESLFLQRKNPRRIAWTTLYRRQHKKGITEEQAKKRTRRTVKQQRGIVGASLDVIKERRSQRPEAREAARKEAIAKGKEKKATSESKKKAEKAKSAAAGARGQPGRIQSKMGSKGVPNKASGKTR